MSPGLANVAVAALIASRVGPIRRLLVATAITFHLLPPGHLPAVDDDLLRGLEAEAGFPVADLDDRQDDVADHDLLACLARQDEHDLSLRRAVRHPRHGRVEAARLSHPDRV